MQPCFQELQTLQFQFISLLLQYIQAAFEWNAKEYRERGSNFILYYYSKEISHMTL